MPISRKYKCPDCDGVFHFLHMTPAEGPPEHCELCGNYMGEEAEPELSAPSIGGSDLSRSVDKVYASMEREIGVTNLGDNLRVGDVAARSQAKVPDNSVSQYAAQSGHTFWQGGAPTEYIAQSRQGPNREHTGAGALAALQGGRR